LGDAGVILVDSGMLFFAFLWFNLFFSEARAPLAVPTRAWAKQTGSGFYICYFSLLLLVFATRLPSSGMFLG